MLNILVGGAVLFVYGALWFTVLFGKKWAKLMDFNPASDHKYKDMGMAKPMVANFLLNLLPIISIYYLYPQVFAFSFTDFWKTVLIVWLGFSFPIYANAAVWERKSWVLVVINSAYGLIQFTIAASLVYFWPM